VGALTGFVFLSIVFTTVIFGILLAAVAGIMVFVSIDVPAVFHIVDDFAVIQSAISRQIFTPMPSIPKSTAGPN